MPYDVQLQIRLDSAVRLWLPRFKGSMNLQPSSRMDFSADRACAMLNVVRSCPESGPATTVAPGRLHVPALGVLALPWFGNQATALSPIALVITLLLVATAVLAFVLTWLLQGQVRRNRQLTQRLQSERELQQATLNALPFPVLLHGLDGQIVAGNRLGRALPERDDDAAALIRDASFAEQKDKLLQGATLRQDVNVPTADGELHAAHLWIRALRDEQEQAHGYASTLLDVTEFRDAEQAARQTEQRLGDMARRMPVVVVAMRIDRQRVAHVSFVTGDARALFSIDATELRGGDGLLRIDALRERIHPDDWLALLPLLSPATHEAGQRTLDFRAFGQNGLRWIHATFATRPTSDGDLGVMGYFIDTTEQNLRNEALRIARDVAERASKAKADFLAAMSHEIRTPMNGVIGMLELLGRTPVNGEQRELLRAVEDSAGSLLQILNDILDFSKLEAGDLRLDATPFDTRQWLDGAIGTMAVAARAKGLDLRLFVDATAAGQLRGDSQRLRQIVINLLNNAIKFTDRGSIGATLTVLGDSDAQQHLSLSVTDTGIGIAQDKQDTLFKPFAQAEAWTSRRYGGTGLGLAICQQLVQLMDGSIELHSEEGVGTTVTVQLRLPITGRATDAPASLHGRHAIVRLASPALATALEQHLRAASLSVERCEPSTPLREGMAASLLFIDADDRESAGQIHAHVVVVSSEPPPPDLGVTWLNGQPLTWRSVITACLRALELDAPDHWQDAPATHRAQALRGRVLVVEDHAVSQRLIARQLTLLGLSSEVVDNGHDALDMLADGDYALLLTDCNMPHMSGYELARTWREREAASGGTQRLPILAMTANAMSSETARAKEAGMDDVLSKPLQLATLGRKLSEWLGELAASVAEPPPPEELQALLAQETRRDLDDLRQHATREDLPAARQSLHRLMGILPLVGDEALVLEGERLHEALHGPSAGKALSDMAGFAERLAQRLANPDHPGTIS